MSKRSTAQVQSEKKYDEKRKGQRSRNFTAIAYPEDLPESWQDMLDEQCLRWVCSPLHDKDVNADCSPKKAHYHLLFMFDAIKSKKQVQDMLGDLYGWSDGSICGIATPQICGDRSALVRYMAHLDNPSKYQYDVADIVGHGGVDVAELLKYSQTETISMMVAIEEYIEEHGITELCDLSASIRYEHPEWYTLVATKCTMYFTAYIRSRRHKYQHIDPQTGEVL